ILDVGCGQGFFSSLLRECGLNVYGLDINETGVRAARQSFAQRDVKLVVGDVLNHPFSRQFDAVFARSLSLYNRDNFASDVGVTESLLALVRPAGVLIFLYNTNLQPSQSSRSWRYHSIEDVRRHFASYPDHRIFFSSKVDSVLLRRHAFRDVSSRLNAFLS